MTEHPITLAVKPYLGQDFYVPCYAVYIRNQEFRRVHDVMSVTYTDSMTEIDSFDLRVNNWDPDKESAGPSKKGGVKYSDGNTLDPWQDVELWMGYYNQGRREMRRMLVGEITTSALSFGESGVSSLTVRGLNLLHRFRSKQISKAFVNEKDTRIADILVGEIASDISKRVPNLTIELDGDDKATNLARETAVPYLAMHNQYPVLFLMQRARAIGYDLTLEEQARGEQRLVTIHFRPSHRVRRPTYELEWGKTLLQFQPTLQTAGQVSEVVVRGWDPQGKDKFEERATRADLNGEELVHPDMLGVQESALAQRLEISTDRPVQSSAEAKELAKKTLRQIVQGLVEARGKTIGLPDLRAGCKVNVLGLGTRYSGTYLVTATTHTIGDGGYTTEFSCRMEARLGGAGGAA
ncbi:MAG TPA: hypothetical protein VG937_10525 [Polyangiaceae bacterium]|nr:hypothetical protein [Polyangiaceae bacterium]